MMKSRIIAASFVAALLVGASGGAALAQTDTPDRPPATTAEAPSHHGRGGGMDGGMTHEGSSGRHGMNSDQTTGNHHQGRADQTPGCSGSQTHQQPPNSQPGDTTDGEDATS